MAYPKTRSMNRDLEEGMTDGRYKKVVTDRGGIHEGELLYKIREELDSINYGINEIKEKEFGDSTRGVTPDYVETHVNDGCCCNSGQ
jgi:hypothetical protein